MLGVGDRPKPCAIGHGVAQVLHDFERDVVVAAAVDHKHRLADSPRGDVDVDKPTVFATADYKTRPGVGRAKRQVGQSGYEP